MKIFISHSSRDRDFVRRLSDDLKRADMDLWVDESDLRVGEDLGTIGDAISSSDCLVVVASASAAASHWVEWEMGVARSVGVRVLPVLLADAPKLWEAGLAELAFADFRRPQDYRRSVHRLIAAIEGVSAAARFLSAKAAVARVRREFGPAGDLFGISQQGVAQIYSLTNVRDWEFADAADGTSRFWVAEFYDAGERTVQAYAVVDGTVHKLPELHLYDVDPVPLPDSVVSYSCSVNHLLGLSEDEAAAFTEAHPEALTTISRRYVRFRPVVLVQEFIDSDVAVAAATASAFGSAGLPESNANLVVLARLECDKRNWQRPTWTVAFFDPALTESVRAVGVDAATGAVRNPRMAGEIINAAMFTSRLDETTGNIVLGIPNQLRAMGNRVWDIPEDGKPATPGMSVEEAFATVVSLLESRDEADRWQLGFVSNAGVIETALSPALRSSGEGLMKRDGTAGQWVFELFGLTPTPVRDGDRHGYGYDYLRIVCTREQGPVVRDEAPDTMVLTMPLARSPLPVPVWEAYDRARRFAMRCVEVDFLVMSVATRRASPEAAWYFRFYDSGDIAAKVAVSGDGHRKIDW